MLKGIAASFYTLTVSSTPEGAFLWTSKARLFRHDPGAKQWKEIKLSGDKLPGTNTDRSGISYDSKRHRLLCTTGVRKAPYDGQIYAIDMKTFTVKALNPAGLKGAAAGITAGYLRETCYDAGNDLFIVGELLSPPEGKLRRTAAYDCANNRWVSLKLTGKNPVDPRGRGKARNVSLGLMYDANRKLVWAIGQRQDVHAVRIDPKTADMKPLE